MKKRKILSFILQICLLLFYLAPTGYGIGEIHETDAVPAPPAMEANASSAVLMDAFTGELLLSQNGSKKCYPASTTKIMTCYLALKYGNLQDTVTITSKAFSGMTAASSTAGLQTGEQLTVYELMQCLMMVSANEAANALAIYISGSISDFVELMNVEATELGCENTHFTNANGLHDTDHYTTAEDLAMIAYAAIQYESFRSICATTTITLKETESSGKRVLTNTNYLLKNAGDDKYDYPGAWGIKTGYTTPAGYCLVSAADKDNRTLLCVVLGADKSGIGKDEVIGSFTESARLLDWGFENFETAKQYYKYANDIQESDELSGVPENNIEDSSEESDMPTDVANPDEISDEGSVFEQAETENNETEIPEDSSPETNESSEAWQEDEASNAPVSEADNNGMFYDSTVLEDSALNEETGSSAAEQLDNSPLEVITSAPENNNHSLFQSRLLNTIYKIDLTPLISFAALTAICAIVIVILVRKRRR